jgi:hypothetical protein
VSEVRAYPGREVALGPHSVVRRLLPHAARRTVGAWCFADSFGPDDVFGGPGMQVPPHPHTGLQTATWLVAGAVRHTDSLGTDQVIRPGQLNLMTAGHGISHAEVSPDGRPPVLHGLQLWIALPEAEAGCAPSFEHHADLPRLTGPGYEATVAVGELMSAASPAHTHTPLVGAEIALTGAATLALRPEWEYAVVLLVGSVRAAGRVLDPGALLWLGDGRAELHLDGAPGSRVFLLGGAPFADELVMWWNFVGRSHAEIAQARTEWMDGVLAPDPTRRFGVVSGYEGAPLPAPELPRVLLKPRPSAPPA